MGKRHLEQVLKETLEKGKKCFVPYIMAGDGGVERLIPQLRFLEKSGATMIEIGIPFSDPAADGPVIQQAGIRALRGGTTIKAILEELKNVRKYVSVPLIFMTYLNPVLAIGIKNFAAKCQEIGIDACIIPDVPLEEEEDVKEPLKAKGIALIRLVSVVSPKDRLRQIQDGAEGFLYAITVKGVTGVRDSYSEDVHGYLRNLKDVSHVPVLAGFGISSVEQAKELSQYCDGVIVGSHIVNCFAESRETEIEQFIQQAMDMK